jgi:hypothetical protein
MRAAAWALKKQLKRRALPTTLVSRARALSVPLVPALLGVLGACSRPLTAAEGAASSRTAAGASAADRSAGPFVRLVPGWYERRGVDACAYPDTGEAGSACIDALVIEPDPVRARYMRRLSAAQAARQRAPLSSEVAECCNRAGVCGAPKRTGHEDCPRMDDGYACLVAAELRLAAKQDPAPFHGRACACNPERAQIPVTGGVLACSGERPVKRAAIEGAEARATMACAVCEPAAGALACAAEVARLRPRDPELARYIERYHVTRCQVP